MGSILISAGAVLLAAGGCCFTSVCPTVTSLKICGKKRKDARYSLPTASDCDDRHTIIEASRPTVRFLFQNALFLFFIAWAEQRTQLYARVRWFEHFAFGSVDVFGDWQSARNSLLGQLPQPGCLQERFVILNHSAHFQRIFTQVGALDGDG